MKQTLAAAWRFARAVVRHTLAMQSMDPDTYYSRHLWKQELIARRAAKRKAAKEAQ